MHFKTSVVLLFLDLAVAGPIATSKETHHWREAGYQQEILANIAPKKFASAIKSYQGLLHTINITIGTPPQNFNVSLELAENGFFVPSRDCDEHCASYRDVHRYNSSLSTTYEPNGTRASVIYWNIRFEGQLSRDTVRVGDLEVRNETFEEYDDQIPMSVISLNDGYDGMLGLAPPWDKSEHSPYSVQYPSFLSMLSEQELIEENVFALQLPRGLEDEGEIMFGGTNTDLYTGDFKTVALSDDSDVIDMIKGRWNVPISSLTLNTSIPYHWPLENYTVNIGSDPLIILPTQFYRDVVQIIGARAYNWYFDEVPCDRRPYLPELTFNIGDHNLTITAFEYTFEFAVGHGYEPVCLVAFDREPYWGNGTLWLGAPFLKGFYTKFDFGKKEIGFAALKRDV